MTLEDYLADTNVTMAMMKSSDVSGAVCVAPQGEVGGPGQKGSKGDKGELVSDFFFFLESIFCFYLDFGVFLPLFVFSF